MRGLVEQCLTVNKDDRPPAMELLMYPIFASAFGPICDQLAKECSDPEEFIEDHQCEPAQKDIYCLHQVVGLLCNTQAPQVHVPQISSRDSFESENECSDSHSLARNCSSSSITSMSDATSSDGSFDDIRSPTLFVGKRSKKYQVKDFSLLQRVAHSKASRILARIAGSPSRTRLGDGEPSISLQDFIEEATNQPREKGRRRRLGSRQELLSGARLSTIFSRQASPEDPGPAEDISWIHRQTMPDETSTLLEPPSYNARGC
jgi:hypothetical protein